MSWFKEHPSMGLGFQELNLSPRRGGFESEPNQMDWNEGGKRGGVLMSVGKC